MDSGYDYDGDGRLVVRRWSRGDEGDNDTAHVGQHYQKTWLYSFVYDEWVFVVKHYYLNGRPVAMRRIEFRDSEPYSEDLYYLHHDHLGSVVLVTDDQGSPVEDEWYPPFGSPPGYATELFAERGYTGQRFDSVPELYYYGARWYDPWLGQFTQPDALVPEPLHPLAWNRYAYAYNSPLVYVDPSGYFAWDVGLPAEGRPGQSCPEQGRRGAPPTGRRPAESKVRS